MWHGKLEGELHPRGHEELWQGSLQLLFLHPCPAKSDLALLPLLCLYPTKEIHPKWPGTAHRLRASVCDWYAQCAGINLFN